MINVLCTVNLSENVKKEIQQMIDAGMMVEKIVDKLGVCVEL